MTAVLTDQDLLERASHGDSQAVDQLLSRYKNLVRHKASLMYMAGADREDVIQEGMIGLYKAIRAYDPGKGVPFPAFAAYCVMTQITDAVRQAGRLKHQMLNQSVSLQSLLGPEHSGQEIRVDAMIPSRPVSDPEQLLLDQEAMADLMAFMQTGLTVLERKVILLFLQQLSYQQIADYLDVTAKSVDNALRRARRKFLLYRAEQQKKWQEGPASEA